MTSTLPRSPLLFSSPQLQPACFSSERHTLRGRSRLCASLRLLAIRVQKFMLFPQGYCAAADADSLFSLSLPLVALSLVLFTLLILYSLSHTLTHTAWQEESGLKGGFGRI